MACDAVPVVLAMTAVSSDAASKAASLLWVLATNSNNHPRLVQVTAARSSEMCVCVWLLMRDVRALQGGCAAVLSKLLVGPADVASKVGRALAPQHTASS